MSLAEWVDAAYPPNSTQAYYAKRLGYVACGFYLPGIPASAALNEWTKPEKVTLDTASLLAVPIVVPPLSLASDPVLTADAAFTQAVAFGLAPEESVLYPGNHLEQTGQITGGLWLPIPGPAPSSIGARSAIQWGSAVLDGWNVDVSSAAPDFPFDRCIVVDFEHSTAGGAAAVAWYQAFQARIAELAGAGPAPAPAPTPPISYPEDDVNVRTLSVGISGGHGWAQLPAPVTESTVINAVVITNDPVPTDSFGLYPTFVGVTNDGTHRLVFGPGPGGPAPNGEYGFLLWSTN
jgi:hypothetical protein